MGQGAGGSDGVLQELGPFGGVWGAATLWPGDGRYVYVPSVSEPASSNETKNSLRFFTYGQDGAGNPHISLAATTPEEFSFGSGSPILTSNGTASGSGILWTTLCPVKACAEKEAELRAYTAVPGSSSPKPFWSGKVGLATKFSRPDASSGHVYVGNHDGRLIAFSSPMLTPSSGALDFAAPLGGHLAREVTLTSTGTEVEVRAVNPPTGPFQASGLPAKGTKLKPGQSITVTVTFTPASRGTVSGEFGIVTQGSEAKVALSGAGEESAQERAEREARETAGQTTSTGVLASSRLVAQAPGSSGASPLISLTKLKLNASASKLSTRRRRLVVTYTLSTAGTVKVVIYRRLNVHGCKSGSGACVRWVATKLKLKVQAHAGSNRLAVNLGTLASGDYRLGATPLAPSGAVGYARYVRFRTSH
jgi:hypothetical protein